MRKRLIVVVGGLVLSLMLVGSPRALAEATCSTFNAASEPATSFRGGEKLTVRGTGFAPRAVVLVSIVQGSRSIDLDRPAATDLGAFTASDLTLPLDLVSGKASIRAIDARGSATCGLNVLAAAASDDDGLGGLLAVWGALLALIGVFLGVLTWRRFKTQKINSAMEQLGWASPVTDDTEERHPVYEAPLLDEPVEPLPLRRVPPPSVQVPPRADRVKPPAVQVPPRVVREKPSAVQVPRPPAEVQAPTAVVAPERPASDPVLDGDPDEWYYGGATTGRARPSRQPTPPPARPARPAGRPVSAASRRVEEPHPLAAYGYTPEGEVELPDEPVEESGSQAIERLRREVQSWRTQ